MPDTQCINGIFADMKQTSTQFCKVNRPTTIERLGMGMTFINHEIPHSGFNYFLFSLLPGEIILID